MPDDAVVTETGDAPTMEERLAAAEERLAASDRREAFTQTLPADVLASPIGQLFQSTYTGELGMATIRGKAIELGLIPDPNAGTDAAAQAGNATDAEIAAAAQADQLRAGGAPTGHDFGPDPRVQAKEAGDAARKRGTTDDGMAAYFASAISSAAAGDPRATRNPAAEYFGSGRAA